MDGTESRYVGAALTVVALIASAHLLGWAVHSAVYEPHFRPPTERCLRSEKGLEVRPAERDPIGAAAAEGAIQLTVEGNGVHVVFASSRTEAARIVAAYERVAGPLRSRIEQRGRIVYLWEGVPSPTQRQILYDCWYG
jgi:hypothetical protein